ncbi:MAG: response regulator [Phycisphaerae bacterium]
MTDSNNNTMDYHKILVVEDEHRLREMLLRAIPEMGYRATGAGSAEQAIAIMERDPHGIILLDLNLPVMNGIEAMEILHERWPEAGVIIMTGFGDLEAAQQAIRLGVIDFLSKPCSLGDLEKAIDRARRQAPEKPAISDELLKDDAWLEPEEGLSEAMATGTISLAEVERNYILAAVARHAGNREAAADELGISVRKLYYRLSEYQRSHHTHTNGD